MNKQCVNCPGATDHTTAECPVMNTQKIECLKHFTDHRFEQLAVFENGRTPIYLTEEQYNAIRALVAQAEPILVQAVAVTRNDDDDGLSLDWLLEGGISELEFAGTVLFALPEANDLCDEDGSAYLYRHTSQPGAELTTVRCQCCQAEHAADSYGAGFIAGSGMCQVCDAAMPPRDLPVAGIEEVEVVAYQSGKSGMCYGEPYGLEVAKPLMTVEQHRRILDALINTPHTDEWFSAVRLEAAHQIQRWGTDHDAGKQPADWFWLLGYLSQKAMAAQMAGDEQKAKHHTISSGAMLLNWFRAMVGDTNAMRPGIAQDQQEQQP